MKRRVRQGTSIQCHHLTAFELTNQLLYMNFPSLERKIFQKDLKSTLLWSFKLWFRNLGITTKSASLKEFQHHLGKHSATDNCTMAWKLILWFQNTQFAMENALHRSVWSMPNCVTVYEAKIFEVLPCCSLTRLNLSASWGGKCLNWVYRHPSQLSVPEVPATVPPQLRPYWWNINSSALLEIRDNNSIGFSASRI